MSEYSILVVDDTEANVDILVDLLADHYEISVAMNGESALESVAEELPDLILLDVMMPDINGYKVCQQLKSNKDTKHIPVIFVTALEKDNQEEIGLKLGAVDYITKPFNPDLVKLRVDNHIKLIKASRALKQQNKLLIENQTLRDDVENIARHDLKTPLSTLINIPDLLMKESNITDEQKEMLEMISESGLRVMDIINSSIDLYKMEKGEYELRWSPVDLVKIVQKLRGEISQVMSTKEINIRITIKGEPVGENETFIVYGEEALFYSMFVNLIKNAVEASPEGESVSIGMELKDDTPVILINNNSLIPEEIRDTFFDKNVTHGKEDGSGLGTYSAQLIAKTLKGKLSFISNEQNGTTLIVTLTKNLKRENTEPSVPFYPKNIAKKNDGQIEALVKKNRKMTIMVLDDYPIMRGTIVSILKQMGFDKFIRLSNGMDGLKTLQTEKVDMIISDYNMPKMDGLQLLEQVKRVDHLKNIPFLMITAEAAPQFVQRAANLEVSGFIVKPFSADVLMAKIGTILENHNQFNL